MEILVVVRRSAAANIGFYVSGAEEITINIHKNTEGAFNASKRWIPPQYFGVF